MTTGRPWSLRCRSAGGGEQNLWWCPGAEEEEGQVEEMVTGGVRWSRVMDRQGQVEVEQSDGQTVTGGGGAECWTDG